MLRHDWRSCGPPWRNEHAGLLCRQGQLAQDTEKPAGQAWNADRWRRPVLGTGFHSHADGTLTAVQYEGGVAMGAYSPPCFVMPPHGFSIDISGYTEDDVDGYEPGELQNKQSLAYAWERCLLMWQNWSCLRQY